MKKIAYQVVIILFCCNLLGCGERGFSPENFDGDYGFVPLAKVSQLEVELGRSLFFDKILSGNKNISCATCHHPSVSSTDGLALGIGEGGSGVGETREDGKGQDRVISLVPRNSPALFNLGSNHFTALFHDGRVERRADYPSGVKSPAGLALPSGLKSLVSAQAMFPVTSVIEMAGVWYENEIGGYAELSETTLVWYEITERVQDILPYASAFRSVYGLDQAEIGYVHIANAIGAFIDAEFRSIESPFDHYIQGDKTALTAAQKEGMELFYGKAKCASCHAGVLQTDSDFHSIALPQVGPGKRGGRNVPRRLWTDLGRELVTENPIDRHRFKTPSLRNVELTAPYGHDGAYRELEAIVRHHIKPEEMMLAYDCATALKLPDLQQGKRYNQDCALMRSVEERKKILASSDLPKVSLTDKEITALVTFLKALTDENMRNRSGEVPDKVLSGLTVKD